MQVDFSEIIKKGASGVGTSAIQLITQRLGKAIAVVSSTEKTKFCKRFRI